MLTTNANESDESERDARCHDDLRLLDPKNNCSGAVAARHSWHTMFPPAALRRLLASAFRGRPEVRPTPLSCGGLRRARNFYSRPGHKLGDFEQDSGQN